MSYIPKVRLVRSTRLPLPTLQFDIEGVGVMRMSRFLRKTRCLKNYYYWKPKRTGSSTYSINYNGTVLELTLAHLGMMSDEWNLWKEIYLPLFQLGGKTVLDVGAGSGETAFFYFLNGAEKVIAIEPNPIAVKLLRRNAKRNKWNVDILPRCFKLADMDLDYDFMKMDGEGCEELLLDFKRELNPSIIEVHNRYIAEKLSDRFKELKLVKVWENLLFLTSK